jgi:hypothetical protein
MIMDVQILCHKIFTLLIKHKTSSMYVCNNLLYIDFSSILENNDEMDIGPGNQVGLKLNGTRQLLAYTDDVNLLGDNIDTVKKHTETLIDASKEVGLEINIQKTKYILLYLGTTVTNQNLIQKEIKRRGQNLLLGAWKEFPMFVAMTTNKDSEFEKLPHHDFFNYIVINLSTLSLANFLFLMFTDPLFGLLTLIFGICTKRPE